MKMRLFQCHVLGQRLTSGTNGLVQQGLRRFSTHILHEGTQRQTKTSLDSGVHLKHPILPASSLRALRQTQAERVPGCVMLLRLQSQSTSLGRSATYWHSAMWKDKAYVMHRRCIARIAFA